MRSIVFIFSAFVAFLSVQPSMAESGVFTLLVTKPFVAKATVSTSSPGSFKLSLRNTDGHVSTFETISSRVSAESQFVEQLKPDRSYAFPQCIVDYLGLKEAVATIRALSAPGLFEAFKRPQRAVMDLGREHPFRAMVLDQALGEEGYSIVLQAANSQIYHVSGRYGIESDKRIVEQLKRGESFEFPAALDDLLLTTAEREAKVRRKSSEVAALARYLGAWSGTREDDEEARVQMNCHWLADGRGI